MATSNTGFTSGNLPVVIVAAALETLREMLPIATKVEKDFALSGAKIGQTFVIQKQAAIATEDITPAVTPPATGGRTYTNTTITISNWKAAPFIFTNKEQHEIMVAQLIPECVKEAARAIANSIESSLYTAAKANVYGRAGAYNANPFASNINYAADLQKAMDDQLAPDNDRYLALGTAEYNAALKLDDFKKQMYAGDSEAFRQGRLGSLYGFDVMKTQVRPVAASAGTAASWVLNGAATADATTIAMTGGSGAFVAGDLITVTDASTAVVYYYCVTANSSGTSIAVSPAVQAAHATSSAIAVVGASGSYARNLAFQKGAFGLIMRIPNPMDGLPSLGQSAVMQDPVTGVPLKVTVYPEYEQCRVELSAMWGVTCIDPRKAAWLLSTGS